MKTKFLPLLPVLLLLAACKKDSAQPTPSNTDRLTASAWKESTQSLTLNGTEGTRTLPANSATTYRFTADGRVTATAAGGSTSSGTWAFASNDTQLLITPAGSSAPNEPLQVFALSASGLSYGHSYSQAQIQQALAGGSATNGRITLLLLSAGGYTFPAGTPTLSANQLTSLQFKSNLVPQQ